MENFIVLDIETSGLDPQKHSILSLGAIDFNTDEQFYCECRIQPSRDYTVEALNVNGFSPYSIVDDSKMSVFELYQYFLMWAGKRKTNLLGGHNVGHFDISFLENVHANFNENSNDFKVGKFPFSYRTIDLHSIYYGKYGKSLSHEKICIELGLEPEPKPHNALAGAKSEKAALSLLLNGL